MNIAQKYHVCSLLSPMKGDAWQVLSRHLLRRGQKRAQRCHVDFALFGHPHLQFMPGPARSPGLKICKPAGCYGTQDCKGAVVLTTHDLVSALAVSFIIHLQLLNKSALHHVWSKLFLQDELTSTFLSYFLLIFVLGRFHLSGRHAGRNKTLLLIVSFY